ncbi:MAG: hypothetical protein ING19_13000, partial [Azospirillum sp.]|nr:hypothetical protein [Azospirillum sp.]
MNSSVQDSLSRDVAGPQPDAAGRNSLPIMKALEAASVTLQAGGGIGTDFSTIRPKRAFVKGVDASASGPVSFMKIWDAMCKTIMSAGARRGAMMATLADDHPDVLEFIGCKREKGVLTQFNISVLISNAFMEAVKNDAPWELGFWVAPIDGKTVGVKMKKVPSNHVGVARDENGMAPWYIYEIRPARDIWDAIMRNTYDYAEPGVIFIDRINERNNLRHSELISCTNPCVTGDTLVLTSEGWVAIEAMTKGKWEVMGSDGRFHAIEGGNAFKTGVKEVFEVRLSTGAKIKATADHRFLTRERGDVPLSELTSRDTLYATPGHLSSGLRKVANGGYEPFEFISCSIVGKPRSLGRQVVYDLTEPATSHFVANGVVVHNCGEQPLPPNSICNLFAINVAAFVKTTERGVEIDWEDLDETAFLSARFGDNVIETTEFPLPSQREEARRSRRIGLGIMGLADLFIMKKMRYGSPESVELAEALMRRIAMGAYRGSVALAAERGECPGVAGHRKEFEKAWLPSKIFAADPKLRADFRKHGIRNGVLLTIAPTGTTANFAALFSPYAAGADAISSGLEPNFSLRGGRYVLQPDGGKKFHPIVYAGWVAYCRDAGLDPATASTSSTDVPDYVCTSMETHTISLHEHVVVQEALQNWIDASISKTINCPEDISFDAFQEIYLDAYRRGLKGCTTYRPSDARGTVLVTETQAKANAEKAGEKPADIVAAIVSAAGKIKPPRRAEGARYKDRWEPWETSLFTQIFWAEGEDGKKHINEIFFSTKNQTVAEFTTALGVLLSTFARAVSPETFREALVELSQIVGVTGAFVPGDKGGKSTYYKSVVSLMASRVIQEMDLMESKPAGILRPAIAEAT